MSLKSKKISSIVILDKKNWYVFNCCKKIFGFSDLCPAHTEKELGAASRHVSPRDDVLIPSTVMLVVSETGDSPQMIILMIWMFNGNWGRESTGIGGTLNSQTKPLILFPIREQDWKYFRSTTEVVKKVKTWRRETFGVGLSWPQLCPMKTWNPLLRQICFCYTFKVVHWVVQPAFGYIPAMDTSSGC